MMIWLINLHIFSPTQPLIHLNYGPSDQQSLLDDIILIHLY